MNQTSWIAAFLFIGFIVYVTVKGQLPQYKAAIFGTGQSNAAANATAAGNPANPTGSESGTLPAVPLGPA